VKRPLGIAALGALALLAMASTRGTPHEVRPGDTLTAIAARTLGDAALWPALYRANRDQIRDPARLYPGQKLAIPALSPAEREALRRQARLLRSK
jgi:nucleoid-associated protein YgaU